MRTYQVAVLGLLSVVGLAWVVGQQGSRSVAAQTGGLPALEQRVAALEALVQSLEQTNTGQAAAIAALTTRLDQAETDLAAVEAKTAPISIAGSDFVITGMNVYIEDGSGATESNSGLGNLTIGYNVPRGNGTDLRTGTHNLLLGDGNNFSSYGGLVAGDSNSISRPYATVTGGFANQADGYAATVSAGSFNTASGVYASVLGGRFNTASGDNSTVSGGENNSAQAGQSSVSGGINRVAPFLDNWAAGGLFQDH